MTIATQELTVEDLELIEFARSIIDANTDGEDGVHTLGAAVRGVDGRMYGGVNVHPVTGGPCAELVARLPPGAVWSVGDGTDPFDPAIFEGRADPR